MKVIIQIPCYNEALTLPQTLAELPRSLPGVDVVEWLVVDDGSRDGTADVARAYGVDHVVAFSRNRGLAAAFVVGIQACLERGADIIVNTDADNQYRAEYIESLIAPILADQADYTVGARPISDIEHFSRIKKLLQRLGSLVVRLASKTDIPDATSGFRAVNRAAAKELQVFSQYTYTLETIIQAGQRGWRITWVPIGVNPPTRPSRLMRTIPEYIFRSISTIVRVFVIYRPFRFFSFCGSVLMSIGLLLALRFIWFYLHGEGGHIQSLIFASIFFAMGFQVVMTGFVVDLLSVNRRILEDIRGRVKDAAKKDE